MEEKDIAGSGIRALDIVLIESHFKREHALEYLPEQIQNNIYVDVNHEIKEERVYVTETLHFEQTAGDKKQIDATITMVAIFEKFGDTPLSLDEFGKVNGPAIIFPFIREQLASLTLKSGIGQIILPPLNFVKKAELTGK